MSPPAPITLEDVNIADVSFPFHRTPVDDENGSPHTPARSHTPTIPFSSSQTHRADTPLYPSPLIGLRFGGAGGGKALHREGALYEGMFRSPVSPIELFMTSCEVKQVVIPGIGIYPGRYYRSIRVSSESEGGGTHSSISEYAL